MNERSDGAGEQLVAIIFKEQEPIGLALGTQKTRWGQPSRAYDEPVLLADSPDTAQRLKGDESPLRNLNVGRGLQESALRFLLCLWYLSENGKEVVSRRELAKLYAPVSDRRTEDSTTGHAAKGLCPAVARAKTADGRAGWKLTVRVVAIDEQTHQLVRERTKHYVERIKAERTAARKRAREAARPTEASADATNRRLLERDLDLIDDVLDYATCFSTNELKVRKLCKEHTDVEVARALDLALADVAALRESADKKVKAVKDKRRRIVLHALLLAGILETLLEAWRATVSSTAFWKEAQPLLASAGLLDSAGHLSTASTAVGKTTVAASIIILPAIAGVLALLCSKPEPVVQQSEPVVRFARADAGEDAFDADGSATGETTGTIQRAVDRKTPTQGVKARPWKGLTALVRVHFDEAAPVTEAGRDIEHINGYWVGAEVPDSDADDLFLDLRFYRSTPARWTYSAFLVQGGKRFSEAGSVDWNQLVVTDDGDVIPGAPNNLVARTVRRHYTTAAGEKKTLHIVVVGTTGPAKTSHRTVVFHDWRPLGNGGVCWLEPLVKLGLSCETPYDCFGDPRTLRNGTPVPSVRVGSWRGRSVSILCRARQCVTQLDEDHDGLGELCYSVGKSRSPVSPAAPEE